MDLSSTEIFPQILVALVVAIVIFLIFLVMETLYKAYLSYGYARIDVYPVTGSNPKTFVQDPNNAGNKTLPYSENQLTGIEFSYSVFLYISDKTFGSDSSDLAGWKNVFYKGYTSGPFPLLGPGVFVGSDPTTQSAATLRVVMNTYDNWYNPIDVKQIPVNKWFHLALVLRKNTMEVYVNGNLANKKSFAGTLPYQNYQPLNFFSNRKNAPAQEFTSTETTIKRNIPAGDNLYVTGAATGYISNMVYFTYAMTYSEIQNAMNIGPSNEFDQENMDRPPYLIDSWWTQRKG
jgi:hypothetical protein